MANYPFTISEDFLNDLVNSEKFIYEIKNSSISSVDFQNVIIKEDSDSCVVEFDGELTSEEETTLNNLAAAHDGASMNYENIVVGGDEVGINTTKTVGYDEAHSEDFTVDDGDYLITIYYETKVT